MAFGGTGLYNLETVPGYAQLNTCGQQAVSFAVEPSYATYGDCQANDPPRTYASCMCGPGYNQALGYMDAWHSGYLCSTVSVWNPVSVFRNFCSVELGQLAPVASAVGEDPGSPFTGTAGLITSVQTRAATATGAITASPGDSVGFNFPSATATATSAFGGVTGSGTTGSNGSNFSSNGTSGGLSTTAIIIIAVVVGIIVLGLIIGAVLLGCFFYRRRKRRAQPVDMRSHYWAGDIQPEPTVVSSHTSNWISSQHSQGPWN